ncbi:MAG TPA: FecR family protein [Allosphingosinicella sp.]|jgi:hypothetical protein
MVRTVRIAGHAFAAAAAFGLIFTPTVIAAEPRPVGINAAIRNHVVIRGAGTTQPHPAILKARVMLNDEVRTSQASQLQILMIDHSTFTVGSNARISVDRFAFNTATNLRTLGISVAQGAFRFMSGRALGHPGGAASVRTPVASIGIRGTIFEGAVGPDAVRLANQQPGLVAMNLHPSLTKATFVILRGPGPMSQGDTRAGVIDVIAGGRRVTLDRPGSAVFIPGPGAEPIGPFEVTPGTLNTLQRLLRTTPAIAAEAAVALNQARTNDSPLPDEGGSHSRNSSKGPQDRGRGFSTLLLGAIPAFILGLFALGSGNNNDVPVSP